MAAGAWLVETIFFMRPIVTANLPDTTNGSAAAARGLLVERSMFSALVSQRQPRGHIAIID